jgi:hypothetical protein
MDIVKVIREFVAHLDLSGKVLSFSDDGTNTTLILENSYHLREHMQLNVNGTDYLVKSVDSTANTAIVTGVLASASTYVVPNPFFFHGTYFLVGQEMDLKADDAITLPMFYMENVTDEELPNEDSQFATIPMFRFLIADYANYQDWLADEFNEKRLVGLRKLAFLIKKQADDYFKFGEIGGFKLKTYYKLGRLKDKSGAMDALFNKTLSGIEIKGSIPIYDCNC